MTPAIVVRIDIHCYLPALPAHVLVFAREIPRHCIFIVLTMTQLNLLANFGRERIETMGAHWCGRGRHGDGVKTRRMLNVVDSAQIFRCDAGHRHPRGFAS
jgi:hypothetical protein